MIAALLFAQAIRFYDWPLVVAELKYDEEAKVCYQTGSVEDAYRVVRAMLDHCAEQRDICIYGARTVAKWKRTASGEP